MSSTSHLTVAATSETKIDKNHQHFNWRTLPCDGSSNLLHLSSSPTTNSKYLYYVNAEPTQKQSIPPTPSITATTTTTQVTASNARRKLSTISLTVPWYKRTRLPSDDKLSQKSHKMSRDRLLPLDKLFSSGTIQKTTDEEQTSPINDIIPFDESIKLNEKNIRHVKENGYLHNSSHLMTR
ncbi:unnamed protein product [Rotaria sp. Silwood2]|nr:unnamed protein product [Rotaria sp. Silwood2]